TRSRTYEGTGIGLALVQELVKLHGGEVGVRSVEGRGSTFSVSIPTGTAHLPPERIRATRTLASTAYGAMPFVEEALRWLPSDGQGVARPGERDDVAAGHSNVSRTGAARPRGRILLADDNADMRDYVGRLLAEQ